MTPRFLGMEAIQKIQADSINTYGGAHGLRDENLLKSALDRAENRYFYEPNSSIPALAAALSWGLIKNHVFLDGNKRVGLGALVSFLASNGYELNCSASDARDATLHAAASEWNEEQWTEWVVRTARER